MFDRIRMLLQMLHPGLVAIQLRAITISIAGLQKSPPTHPQVSGSAFLCRFLNSATDGPFVGFGDHPSIALAGLVSVGTGPPNATQLMDGNMASAPRAM
jgi:hypothetical protein